MCEFELKMMFQFRSSRFIENNYTDSSCSSNGLSNLAGVPLLGGWSPTSVWNWQTRGKTPMDNLLTA